MSPVTAAAIGVVIVCFSIVIINTIKIARIHLWFTSKVPQMQEELRNSITKARRGKPLEKMQTILELKIARREIRNNRNIPNWLKKSMLRMHDSAISQLRQELPPIIHKEGSVH
jgi:hypothetical protein